MEKIDIIREIISKEQYQSLYELVQGISEYNVNYDSSIKMTDSQERAWQMALAHLRFLSKYGKLSIWVEENGKRYFSYPEEFEEWLTMGAPGVTKEELECLLVLSS